MTVHVRLSEGAITALGEDPRVVHALGPVAEALVDRMKELAAVNTGAGRDSIHAEFQPENGEWRVGWDQDHWYMIFPELGTIRQPAHPCARPAADEINARFR